MCIEGVGDRFLIVARLRLEQSLPHERIEFCFVQLDPQTAQAFASALTVAAHAFGSGSRAGG
jgi:hypothetical protein